MFDVRRTRTLDILQHATTMPWGMMLAYITILWSLTRSLTSVASVVMNTLQAVCRWLHRGLVQDPFFSRGALDTVPPLSETRFARAS